VIRGVFLINILVCDDDKNILNQVSKMLTIWCKKHNIKTNLELKHSGDFVLNDNYRYDIAFIDIEMPGISGLRLSEELKKSNPDILIIIITSFQNYLDNAMKIRVFRYLTKPIEPNRFYLSLSDAIHEYRNISKIIVVEDNIGTYIVKTKDILYLENHRYGSIIVTKYGEHKTRKKLEEWYNIINQPECFVYSHKSYIVNLQNVISFDRTSVTFKNANNESVTTYVSQRKYSNLKRAFFDFAGGLV